ncbi:MAG: hypothetical protein Q9218_002298 [Villophora microphyllina]
MDGADDRPLAVRRKRRGSMAPIEVRDQGELCDQVNQDSTAKHGPCNQPKTPSKRNKRLRFSEPLVINIDDSSTGLTPALNRTRLISEKSVKKAKQRPSLPAQLGLPAASLSSFPIQIQFAPLKQIIDPRMMRRLKRNHMGEEVNEIYAEKRKSRIILQQQVEELRKELAQAKEQDSSSTIAPEPATDNAVRILELEQELGNLKQEMHERSTTVNPSIPGSPEPSSPATSMPIELDDSHDVCQNLDGIVGSDHHECQQVIRGSPSPVVVVEASTQTPLQSPALSDILQSARLTLKHLFPGENTISLDVSDPEPLLTSLISRLESLKAEAARLENKYTITETAQLNMERHFKNALLQMEHVQQHLKTLNAEVTKEKAHARSAELEISTLEAHCENATAKCEEAKKQRDEHQRSVERLQPAMKHYQDECEKLTRTIMELESSQATAVENLRSDLSTAHDNEISAGQVAFEGAKADLEAQIAAETLGRRKAEESAVERLTRIKQLENHQKELQTAINEKQSILRKLDDDLKQSHLNREQEVGQLNVRISQLETELTSTEGDLAAVRLEVANLSELNKQEKAAGIKAVESIQKEMTKSAQKAEAIKDNYAEGVKQREDISQSFGLITPVVEGGRFRDAEVDEKVEGHVELMRGKKKAQRPDSGIELWDMMNVDF